MARHIEVKYIKFDELLSEIGNVLQKHVRAIPAKNIWGGGGKALFLIQAPIQLHLPLMRPSIKLNFPPPPPIQLRKQQSPTQEFILVLGNEQATYKSKNLLSVIEN